MASGIYIPHPDGRVLLVHHARSKTWVLPGGKGEHESPRQCAAREGTEELRVPVEIGPLLSVHHLTGAKPLFPGAENIPGAYPCNLFTSTAHLAPADWDRITLPADELLGWDLFDVDQAVTTPGLMEQANAANLLACQSAYRTGITAYLEDGTVT
ncbi:hypothetical protein GCM10009664_37240 [Kitasatospora gansuensis]